MTTSRRDFMKTAGLAFGASVMLPSWVFESEAAADVVVDKNKLSDVALSTAKRLGATYADIRINRYRFEALSTREQQVQNVSRTQSFGFGVRALVRGTWGFASSRVVTPEEVRRVTQAAVEIARANSAFQRKPITLVPTPARCHYMEKRLSKRSLRRPD